MFLKLFQLNSAYLRNTLRASKRTVLAQIFHATALPFSDCGTHRHILLQLNLEYFVTYQQLFE